MYSVEIIGDQSLLRNMDQMPRVVQEILVAKAGPIVDDIREDVKANIRERFVQRSGDLYENVESEVYVENGKVVARVYIDDSEVPYARAQEEGAVTPPHMIYPREAKVLAFIGATGDKVFATRVFHPGATITGKRYMADAKRENSPKVRKAIKTAVVQGIRANMRSGG